jgi:hypothetical protein
MPKKTLPRQGLGQETHIQIKLKDFKKHKTRKFGKTKRNEGEKITKYPKREMIPNGFTNSLMRKISMAMSKPQHTE